MINKITIEKFKSIQHIELCLGRVNVLVGANNSGKSSILQAIQFATSVAQTSQMSQSAPRFKKDGSLATSVYPNQLIYSPVKDPYTLAYGGVLKEDEKHAIRVQFEDDCGSTVKATFRKGKNKNISANFLGSEIGAKLLSLEKPFCMYVPGTLLNQVGKFQIGIDMFFGNRYYQTQICFDKFELILQNHIFKKHNAVIESQKLFFRHR